FRQNFNGNTDHAKTVYRYFVDNTPYADGYSVPNYYSNYSYKGYFNSNNLYTSYQNKLNAHFFKIMTGVQSELSRDESVSVKRNQLITDNVPFVTTATGISETDGSKSNWATLGVFGRLNYNFDERFLFEFSSRYDGTSRFQKGRRWGFFPSVSVGYNIAREAFWNNVADRVSMLKIRASFGSLGNQNVPQTHPYLTHLPINSN